MKRNLLFSFMLTAIMVFSISSIASAESKKEEAKKGGSFYSNIWTKLRVFISEQEMKEEETAMAVAGIRGSKAKGDSELDPVWEKGEKKNAAESPEIKMIREAESLASRRQFKQAQEIYEAFMEKYPKSIYMPSVAFALGLTYAELANTAKAKSTLDGFVKDFPKHELVPVAKDIITKLN